MSTVANEINAALAKLELLDRREGTLHRVLEDVDAHLLRARELALADEVESEDYITIGIVDIGDRLTQAVKHLERFGHRADVLSDGPSYIRIVAKRLPVAPIECEHCKNLIAQSWLDDCPHCEQSLHHKPAGVE